MSAWRQLQRLQRHRYSHRRLWRREYVQLFHAEPARRNSPPACPPYLPFYGACLRAIPGPKHKLSREYKLTKLADQVRVPSSVAAAVMHIARRFLLGKTAANPLEAAAFARLGRT